MKKPNIIFVLTDDHGQWGLGCYGNKEVITPTIDALAEKGSRFDNFFCTSPVCSPARASILTGKIPSQHGVLDWIGGGSISREMIDETTVNLRLYLIKTLKPIRDAMLDGKSIEDIPEDATIAIKDTVEAIIGRRHEDKTIQYLKDNITYTELLAKDGYKCGLVGKWHLGDSPTPQCGFTYWKTIACGGTNYSFSEFVEDGKLSYHTDYLTDTLTDYAMEFIEENAKKDQPFYININYTAPHDPWMQNDQPEDIWKLYDDCAFESVPDVDVHPWQASHVFAVGRTPELRKQYLQGYYTTLTAVDNNMKRLFDKLKELDIDDNTIIIFTGDNGMNMGHHGIWGKGNGTFPINMYDTSVKVPFIIYHPKMYAPKVIDQELLSQYDLMPTILKLAGVDYELDDSYPGIDFSGLLEGKPIKSKPIVIYDEYGPVRMVRTDEYKYIHRYPYGPHEFYDLKNDANEENNLIDDENYINKIIEMSNQLETWFIKYVCPELDGTTMPINGWGQNNIANRGQKVKNTFSKN